ncbi:MAG: hypothetical protein ACTSRK_20690 [Promethearchaeota archaeon]
MASTTIRISSEDKKKMDELIAILMFKLKRKVTQEQLMKELVNLGNQYEDKIVENISSSEDNSIDIENDPFFHLPTFKLGKNASENIDDIIYNQG